MNATLDDLLDDIAVSDPDEREYAVEAGNSTWPLGWYAVHSGNEGIVAYFANEEDAFAYRLMLINVRLNAPAILGRLTHSAPPALPPVADASEDVTCPTCGATNVHQHDPPIGWECHDCGAEWTRLPYPKTEGGTDR